MNKTAVTMLAAVAAIGVSACSTGGSGNSGGSRSSAREPAYVARLEQDGMTDIKTGRSNSPYGCPDYAVGEDSNGDGYGELVVQCPTSNAADLLALNLSGIQQGDLVIVTGPLSSL